MANSWQIEEVKDKFSEVVDDALTSGPQFITRHGIETVVVLSYLEYRQLLVNKEKLSEFFQASPMVNSEIDLQRENGPARRDIEFK